MVSSLERNAMGKEQGVQEERGGYRDPWSHPVCPEGRNLGKEEPEGPNRGVTFPSLIPALVASLIKWEIHS